MDSPPLIMPEQVRVWHLAGVRSLFVSEETRKAYLARGRAASADKEQSGPVPLRRPNTVAPRPAAQPYYGPSQRPITSSSTHPATTSQQATTNGPTPQHQAAHGEQYTQQAPSAPSMEQQSTLAKTDDTTITPQAAAPVPDQTQAPTPDSEAAQVWERYTALLPEKPRVIWSYWELGQDLLGKGDFRRSDLWRHLRGQVRWPNGFLGFWPLSALYNEKLVPQAQRFFSGIETIDPRYIIIFGQKGFETLFPNERFALGAKPTHGRIIHILPDPEELIADEGVAMSRTLHLLKAIRSG